MKLRITNDIRHEVGSGNVFLDLGFSRAEAAEMSVKSALISEISDTIKERKLTQKAAARLCDTDLSTLSEVLRGRMESVTVDRLTVWRRLIRRLD